MRRTELHLTFYCALLAVVAPVSAQTWTQTKAPTNFWNSICSSADGSTFAAVGGSGCFISTNSGGDWQSNSLPSPNSLSVIAASADGMKLAGARDNTPSVIDVSTNGGFAWASPTNYSDQVWPAIVCSKDFKIQVLTEDGPNILASTNSGATWYLLAQLPNNGSQSAFAAMSANGRCLVVAVNDKCICSTTNFGGTWATNNLAEPWEGIAASADGTKVVAAPYGGNIYTSTDSGVTWVPQTNSPNLLWWSVASSADGTKLAAVSGRAGGPGRIYTSADSGASWTSNNAPDLAWTSVASSADGNMLVAAVSSGGIWTLQTTPTPQLNLAPVGNNIALSWIIPSTNFALQQSPDLASWAVVTNIPALNLTNLQDQISLSPSNSSGFYRLATP
jgi:hypothetical protein